MYKINDIFIPVDMPENQKVTINYTDKINGIYVPAKKGWNESFNSKPVLSEWSSWIESYGNDDMCLLCPSSFSTEQRTKSDKTARCFWLGLDFDSVESPALSEMINGLSDFQGFYYTTKSHQKDKKGVTCERYRVFMSYSRPLTHEENIRVHKTLGKLIHHDSSCGDITRVFSPSVKGCLSGALGGSYSVDIDHILDISEEIGINENQSIKTVPIDRNGIDWNRGTVDKKLRKSINQIWKQKYKSECDNGLFNTRDAVWNLIHRSFVITADLPDIYHTIMDIDDLSNWAYRKRDTENLKSKIIEAYQKAVSEKCHTEQFQQLLKSSMVDMSNIPDLSQEYLNQMSKLGHGVNSEQIGTHRLINHYSGKGRFILNIACGLQKSVSACVYASIKKDIPTWLICENHKAVNAMIERLKILGVPDSDIGYIAGFNQSICKQPQRVKNIPKRDIYNQWKSPCKGCQYYCECPTTNRIFPDKLKKAVRKPIVVMTHKMFTSKFQPWSEIVKEFNINPDSQIIIDEQLKRWQQGTFSRHEIESALSMGKCSKTVIMDELEKSCIGQTMVGNQNVSGVGMINQSIGVDNRNQALRNIGGYQLNDEESQRVISIITLLSSESKRYVMKSDDKYQIISDKLNWDFPKNAIILDGSARYTQVNYDGFEMLDYIIPSVKGLTVNIVKGNPTQAHIERKYQEYLSTALQIKNESGSNNIVWAKNKGDETFTADNPGDLIANRGTDTKGSNDFINGDMMIVIMSLFTNVHDYALRASLSENREIPFNDIWQIKNNRIVPKMGGNGWINNSIKQSYIRQVIDELYQGIMRISVRKYDRKEYQVVCMLPDLLSVEELRGRLPDCEINLIGFDNQISNNKQKERQASDNLSVSQIRKIHELYRNSIK